MATNLQIDDKLIQRAVRLGGHKTKKAAVSKALRRDKQESNAVVDEFRRMIKDPRVQRKIWSLMRRI